MYLGDNSGFHFKIKRIFPTLALTSEQTCIRLPLAHSYKCFESELFTPLPLVMQWQPYNTTRPMLLAESLCHSRVVHRALRKDRFPCPASLSLCLHYGHLLKSVK